MRSNNVVSFSLQASDMFEQVRQYARRDESESGGYLDSGCFGLLANESSSEFNSPEIYVNPVLRLIIAQTKIWPCRRIGSSIDLRDVGHG